MATGTIKTKTDKGFGFIAVEGSDDVFFHHTACNGQFENLNVGDPVEFEKEMGEKGPKASNVRLAGAGKDTGSSTESADADYSTAA